MYNGWKNYETWNINLWVSENWDNFVSKPIHFNNVQDVKDFVIQMFPDGTPDMKKERLCNVDYKQLTKIWNEIEE